MIVEVMLQNFKRFRELRLRAADLTVLTGANGAGKTSVLHALLLARQMTRQPERDHVELTGVDTLELGGAGDVIHREAVDELAAIEVFDTGGRGWRWSFRAPVNVRTLNAVVVERPVDYAGALGALPPEFTYLWRGATGTARRSGRQRGGDRCPRRGFAGRIRGASAGLLRSVADTRRSAGG